MTWPTIEEIVRALENANESYDADPEGTGVDVRLQVYESGDWALRVGVADYDQDHRGYWGASSFPGGGMAFDPRGVASDLIDQAQEQYAYDS